MADPNEIQDHDIYIGVDRGALILADLGIEMHSAVGDFDSIHDADLEKIRAFSKTMVQLEVVKNESDLEVALIMYHNLASSIVVYGGLGGRQDHQYVNFKLMLKYPHVELVDAHNRCINLTQPQQIKKAHYRYFSIFALEPSRVSIENAKYELDDVLLTPADLYTLSNEFVNAEVRISVKGRVLVILSVDA